MMRTPEEIEAALDQLREVFAMAKQEQDKAVMDSTAFAIMALRWARGDVEAGQFGNILASLAVVDEAFALVDRHQVN